MDTRPWRLPLPPGISWFEVDQKDVLTAKRAELAAAGVQLQGSMQYNRQSQQQQQQKVEMGKQQVYQYPLQASSWATVAADLQKPGWTEQLLQQGFRTDVPTIWVAEGLLYYLKPSTVTPLLQVR
jgi:O-methyltransferase involved in polyketide biosynthesis